MKCKQHEQDVCYEHVGEWKVFLDRRVFRPQRSRFWGLVYPFTYCCGERMWRMKEVSRQYLSCVKCKRMRKRVLERSAARCQVCHKDKAMSAWRLTLVSGVVPVMM